MALTKQPITVNFSHGVDKKTDPYQVELGKFLTLQNSVFSTGKRLQKRNGFGQLASLPDATSTYLTTFNGDLTAIGNSLFAYAPPSANWLDQASMQTVGIDTLSLVKNSTNQSQSDSVIAPNGSICTVYTDQTPTSLTTPVYKYVVADSATGQNIIAPTAIAGADATYGTPKVFLLTTYFIIVYISPTTYNLKFIAVSIANPSVVTAEASVSTSITPLMHGLVFDGVVYNNSVYLAWNGAATSGLKMAFITNHLSVSSTINPDASHIVDVVSVTADAGTGTIWATYYGYVANTTYTMAVTPQLLKLSAFSSAIASIPAPAGTHIANLASSAQNGVLTFFYEVVNAYSYDSGVATNFIKKNTLTEAAALGTASVLMRSVGLASKSFLINGVIYMMGIYYSPYQSTYFLFDSSSDIVAKLAYQNAGGYFAHGLPSVSVVDETASVTYLIKDLIQSVNKNTNVPSGSQVNGIYTQTGVNLASFTFNTDRLNTAEIGTNLNLTGGFTYAYDGYSLTEQGFFLYPDSVKVVADATSGSMIAQKYYYQVTYEWSDNQGNIFRSAPSIPVTVTLTSDTSVLVSVPTLRLSLKNANNPVKIVIYRYSAAQPVYYQATSISSPLINTPSTDSVSFIDTQTDATLLGNNILYTNGGVLENIGAPAFDSLFLFDSRLWGIYSEDKNLLGYSKQVIEGTPIEMSDLLTLYVSPTIGAQGSTGSLKCGAAMDDKLILFKASAMNYVNGAGPDNTGANNGYSQPTFITSTVGCSNQRSIVFQPQGLMFEFASETGNQIWLLSRNLETSFIGAFVQEYTKDATVLSAVSIPGTNQVRFTLSSGLTLMYDTYYGEWATFVNIPAVSSVLYEGLHSYINSRGEVFQETPNAYLDGTNPVLMSFTTSWINLAGLQGYQLAYFFYLMGTYLSPHFLNVQIAYDYSSSIRQSKVIHPSNFNPNYGSGFSYGVESPYGGNTSLEQWEFFLTQQRCQSFQITITEIYDPAFGVVAGAGFTLSGLTIVAGIKKGFRPLKFTQQAGGSS